MIVADTNSLVYLVLPGQFSEQANRAYLADREWAVPRLWRSEFRSVLASYMRRQFMSKEAALEYAARAEEIVRDREFSVADEEVLTLVSASPLSAYDCEFVALALRLGVRLLTNDAAILKAFPGLAVPLSGEAP